jgi:hypothetical protein
VDHRISIEVIVVDVMPENRPSPFPGPYAFQLIQQGLWLSPSTLADGDAVATRFGTWHRGSFGFQGWSRDPSVTACHPVFAAGVRFRYRQALFQNRFGQILNLHFACRCNDERAFDFILEFPDIARPVIGQSTFIASREIPSRRVRFPWSVS